MQYSSILKVLSDERRYQALVWGVPVFQKFDFADLEPEDQQKVKEQPGYDANVTPESVHQLVEIRELKNDLEDYIVIIDHYFREAYAAFATMPGHNSFLDVLRKVCAVAVSALDEHDVRASGNYLTYSRSYSSYDGELQPLGYRAIDIRHAVGTCLKSALGIQDDVPPAQLQAVNYSQYQQQPLQAMPVQQIKQIPREKQMIKALEALVIKCLSCFEQHGIEARRFDDDLVSYRTKQPIIKDATIGTTRLDYTDAVSALIDYEDRIIGFTYPK